MRGGPRFERQMQVAKTGKNNIEQMFDCVNPQTNRKPGGHNILCLAGQSTY